MKLAYVVLLWGLLVYVPLMVPVSAHAGEQADEVKDETAEDQSDKPVEARKQLSDKELWDIYYEFIAEFKPHGIPVDREEHERLIKPKMARRKSYDSFTNTECAVDVRGKEILVRIDVFTGEIRNFRLSAIKRNLRFEKAKPVISKEELTRIGKRWLSLNKITLLKEYNVHIYWRDNYWVVTFRRLLNGHIFMLDRVQIQYSAKYGIIEYRNTMFSDECDTEAKVSKEEAAAAADKFLPEVKKAEIKIPMRRKEVDPLRIINPVYLKLLPSIHTVAFSELRKTRLAWPVVYREASQSDWHVPVVFVLFIDAITGELLCHQAIY